MVTQPPSGLPQISSGLKMWASEIWTTIRSQDIDAVLSFDTPSVVRVRDRYLGSALLRLATFLVELLMIRFMPQREVCCKYKYHETLDFGDYRKGTEGGYEAQDGRPKAIIAQWVFGSRIPSARKQQSLSQSD
ncbi:hypothetical protein DSO57_1015373 [Entomophthora muscae]|uniref:Uncharacterized protein n=1 Tax=Entomophthora muscae TaxID=34485 RepID=A0ACC2RW94_9FUNG|nr:hypothetical protein DSO57_1015373 [Entomophthora muscae]